MEQKNAETIKHLGSLIKDIKIAMVTTVDKDGRLHSRPMATQENTFDGQLYFFVRTGTATESEVVTDQHVNVSYSEPSRQVYVSLTGDAVIVRLIWRKWKSFGALTIRPGFPKDWKIRGWRCCGSTSRRPSTGTRPATSYRRLSVWPNRFLQAKSTPLPTMKRSLFNDSELGRRATVVATRRIPVLATTAPNPAAPLSQIRCRSSPVFTGVRAPAALLDWRFPCNCLPLVLPAGCQPKVY